jgi:hypothetical protein
MFRTNLFVFIRKEYGKIWMNMLYIFFELRRDVFINVLYLPAT